MGGCGGCEDDLGVGGVKRCVTSISNTHISLGAINTKILYTSLCTHNYKNRISMKKSNGIAYGWCLTSWCNLYLLFRPRQNTHTLLFLLRLYKYFSFATGTFGIGIGAET